MMINRRVFSFLKNVLMFLIDRLYRELQYILRNGQSYNEKVSERGDLYVKQLIENIIHDRAGKYDPYLVNTSPGISWGSASVVLGKAQMTGLSTLHRTHICALTEVRNRLFINTNLGAGPLSYLRQISFRLGKIERKVLALISINEIKVSVDFSIEKETGGNGFLLDFTINELNGFKLSINGSVYFDWIINLFLSFWTLVFGRLIRNLLENELEQYIFVKLPKYQFPVEGFSYRNGSKFDIPHKNIQNNEISLSEAFCMKQTDKNSEWYRLSPIGESSLFDRYDSTEYGTAKDFVFNENTTKTSKNFLQTNKWTSEINSSYLPALNIVSGKGVLYKNEDSKNKAEEKYDPISLLTGTLKICRSLNGIKEKVDSISQVPNSPSQKITSSNHLNVLEDDDDGGSLFDWNISDDLNDVDEIGCNSRESTDTANSSPTMDFESVQSFLMCKRPEKVEKESEMEDFSQMLSDSCRDVVKKDSEDAEENTEQAKFLNEISSEIRERSCEKNADAKLLDARKKLQTDYSDYERNNLRNKTELLSMIIESSQIDENILELEAEQYSIETGTLLNQIPIFDSEMTKAKMTKDEKLFLEEVSEEEKETEDLNKNHVSVESCNHCQSLERNFSASNLDFKLRSPGMFQNDCAVKEPEKDTNVYFSVLRQEIEDSESIKGYRSKILSGNQGVETFEAQCVYNPEDGIDNQNRFNSNVTYDSMKLEMIQDETSLDLETETVSTSTRFSEEPENKTDEKSPFKYVQVHIGEELNKDSLFKADDDDIAYSSSSNEELNIPSKLPNENTAYNNLLQKLVSVFNEKDIECPDCMVEFSSIAESKLNADSNKDGLAEMLDPKVLQDLQEVIISKIRKLKSDILESDTEDSEYSASSPILSRKNFRYETEELANDESNLSQKDSNTNCLEITSLLKGNCASLSETEHPILDCKTLQKYGLVSESEADITELAPSERNMESEHT